jgi:hypothetical protein
MAISRQQTAAERTVSERAQIAMGMTAEVVFAVLPLVVVLLVLVHLDRGHAFLASPEWSFGSSILFGQALVRFVSGVGRGGSAANGPMALVVALVLVVGLVPSLIVLEMTFEAAESQIDPVGWVKVVQVVLFLAAAITYILLGTIGEAWLRQTRGRD